MTTPRPLSFGATAWTFSWIPPYEGAIQRIAASGCTHFELGAWNSEMIQGYYTPQRIREIRELAEGEGLSLSSFFYSFEFVLSPGAVKSRGNLEDFQRGIETTASLGAPIITTPTPYPFGQPVRQLLERPTSQEWTAKIDPRWDWKGEFEQVVDSFIQACDVAAQAGLKVAIEPHPFRWVNSAQGMLRLIERCGSTNLGLNFDPSHLFPSGDMPHFTILMLKDRIFNTHLSDNDGLTNAHWRPGRGKIDWLEILTALEAIGYTGPLTLELEDAPGASHWTHTEDATPELDRELTRSIAYLRERHSELEEGVLA